MVYAAILAGGSGSRMHSDLPKQYLQIKKKPIIIYSIEAFASNPRIDGIIAAVSHDYYDYARELITKHCPRTPVTLITGGESRVGTLKNILNHLHLNNLINEKTILLTHDAARPFVDSRIINENITAAAAVGACNTIMPATDTIIESLDGEYITRVPSRDRLYSVQTPQSFNAKKLYELTMSLNHEESASVTDACSIFVLRNEPVKLVRGKSENIKITYPSDLAIAEKFAAKLKK